MSLYKDDEWYIEELDEWAKQESEITNISPNIIRFAQLFNLWEHKNLGPNNVSKTSAIEILMRKF